MSLSKVTDSIALWAFIKRVPPGVSYTPLDLIPKNLFSTKSTLPIPFLPARSFNFVNNLAGGNFFPLIPKGSPFLKLIVTKDGLLGAFSGETVRWKINSGAEFFGFSKTLPSVDVWNKLSSTEKGGAPFLSFGIAVSYTHLTLPTNA